ncbi:MAG: hypothetical protein HC804_07145 [Anaerolineae bacterium]|nr:hypothetical protein [Anaerolineae bacterium]
MHTSKRVGDPLPVNWGFWNLKGYWALKGSFFMVCQGIMQGTAVLWNHWRQVVWGEVASIQRFGCVGLKVTARDLAGKKVRASFTWSPLG